MVDVPVFIAGTIVADGCAWPALSSEGHNLASDGTCNLTDPTDLPNTDPMLGGLQDNGGPTPTHALPGSPAIDVIPRPIAPGTTTAIRGRPRYRSARTSGGWHDLREAAVTSGPTR